MKKSLSSRLMYTYMGLIAVILIGVSIGLSYLITDYFFREKEDELNKKGAEAATISGYFLNMDSNSESLSRYLTSVDQLIGARIWLFDDKFNLIAASEQTQGGYENIDGDSAKIAKDETKKVDPEAIVTKDSQNKTPKGSQILAKIKDDELFTNQVKKLLADAYSGKKVNVRVFHPYYREQVLLVGMPVGAEFGAKAKHGAILLAAPISGLNKVLKDIYLYTIMVGLAALFLSMFFVRQLTKRMIKPLTRMKDTASAIAAGDYTQKVEIDGDDEISDLGRSLNSLTSDLDEFVQKTNKMEKLRRDFVANVSHELRTPITIIRGYNEAIADGIVSSPEDLKKYRQMINEETIRLERLIKELLDISRLQRSDQEELEQVSLDHITNTIVDMLEVRAKARDIRLERDIEDNTLVNGNGDRLFQLVMILGDNAMKYSPDSSSIIFSVKENARQEIVLTVTDHGYGIPQEDIPYIWERFYKVDKSHSRNIPGTGLGLAIGREIIRLHKAKVEVISALGRGTSFIITFPSLEGK